MNEVEALRFDSGKQRRTRRNVDCVPPDVREYGSVQSVHHTRPLAAPNGVDTVLNPVFEQNLHADADTKHRSATGESSIDDSRAVYLLQPEHACLKRAHTGNDETVGIDCRVRVCRDFYLCSNVFKGTLR